MLKVLQLKLKLKNDFVIKKNEMPLKAKMELKIFMFAYIIRQSEGQIKDGEAN